MNNIITAYSEFPFLLLVRDSAWGIVFLIFILVFHGSAINHVYMRFERLTRNNLAKQQYNRVFFHFYAAFVFLAMFHLLEILFWSFFIIGLGIMKTPIDALLFAGSCYTTVGFESDTLLDGWKSFAFFISLSGLFSLAWTTSVMIGMTTAYKNAWDQKYRHTSVYLTKSSVFCNE
ncbi:hypothetical protein C2759_05890 [Polynucleobacter sp. MG-Unter2-18]|uniref:hypothetical protein n=1 Tax=Polynucleobacter sp. MG-Unter2-18 TaxID=2081052 RepID=UPI001BFE7953|nr:hypothetical protein [Polynucleobacter sp. MG-Unter2-18]QWD93746.1 hypothetical protein C2759_05890 [Polynucleobacter sp. MG-Unter2-18]